MPYVFSLTNQAGRDEINSLFDVDDATALSFSEWLEVVVAGAFQTVADETWDESVRISILEEVETSTMPVGITLMIAAWNSGQREKLCGLIADRIREEFRGRGFTVPICVHVNIVPSKADLIDPFDFAKGAPNV